MVREDSYEICSTEPHVQQPFDISERATEKLCTFHLMCAAFSLIHESVFGCVYFYLLLSIFFSKENTHMPITSAPRPPPPLPTTSPIAFFPSQRLKNTNERGIKNSGQQHHKCKCITEHGTRCAKADISRALKIDKDEKVCAATEFYRYYR